jgi:hypothetical protein
MKFYSYFFWLINYQFFFQSMFIVFLLDPYNNNYLAPPPILCMVEGSWDDHPLPLPVLFGLVF